MDKLADKINEIRDRSKSKSRPSSPSKPEASKNSPKDPSKDPPKDLPKGSKPSTDIDLPKDGNHSDSGESTSSEKAPKTSKKKGRSRPKAKKAKSKKVSQEYIDKQIKKFKKKLLEEFTIESESESDGYDSESDSSQEDGKREVPNIREAVKAIGPANIKEFLELMASEDKEVFIGDPDVSATLQDPLGIILFESWTCAKGAGDEFYRPSLKQAKKFCKDFMEQKAAMDKAIGDKVTTAMNLEVDNLKKNFKKESLVDYHQVLAVEAPTEFSPEDTLTGDIYRISTVNQAFNLKNQFSGKGSKDIIAYLTDLTQQQKVLKLSEAEFGQIMRRTSTGEPHALITSLIKRKVPIKDIYHQLLSQYDDGISCNEAFDKLSKYKFTKNNTLSKGLTEVEILAGKASQKYPNEDFNNYFFNHEAISAVMKGLPTYSKKLASEVHANMLTYTNKPEFYEFSKALKKFADSIDADLSENGQPKGTNGDIYFRKSGNSKQFGGGFSKGKNSNSSTGHQSSNNKSVNQISHFSGNKTDKPSNNKTSNHHQKSQGNSQKKTKKYCGLCGLNSHNSQDGCYACFDDHGDTINQALTSGPCSNCESKIKKTLYHPLNLCPIRDRAIQLYRQGTVRPVGHFNRYLQSISAHPVQPEKKGNKQSNFSIKQLRVCKSSKILDCSTQKESVIYNWNQATGNPIKFVKLCISDEPQKLYFTCKFSHRLVCKETYITGQIDTGADTHLVSRSYLGRLLQLDPSDVECYLDESDITLSTYTNEIIKISGKITLDIILPFDTKMYPLTFYVVDDLDHMVTPMLFGLKSLGLLNLAILTHQVMGEPIPILQSMSHKRPMKISQYLTDTELKLARAQVFNLKPFETRFVDFFLSTFFNVCSGDALLLSEDNVIPSEYQKNIQICPTRSIAEYDRYRRSLKVKGWIKNLTNETITDISLLGYVDNSSKYDVKEIDLTNVHLIKDLKFVHEANLDTNDTLDNQPQTNPIHKAQVISVDAENINLVPLQHNFHVNLIDQYFPEDPLYSANPEIENNGMTGEGKSISDKKSKIDELITDSKDSYNPKDYESRDTCIQMGLNTFPSDQDIEDKLTDGRGYSLPDGNYKLTDIVNIDQFEEPIKSHIDRIFLKKFPELISRHSTDKGNMSRYLGKYEIKLKDNVTLPSFNKIYYVSNLEKLQMDSILAFLIKNKTIVKTSLKGDSTHNYASPAYLISRSNKSSAPRLIINYKNINDLIKSEAVNLPTADAMIQGLRDSYFFTGTDLANAFHSIDITENSQDLTIFSCQQGTYKHLSLPTGIKVSPEALNRFVHKAIHYKVVYDKDGKLQFNADGTLVMEHDPIPNVFFIYDDLLMFSEAKATYLEGVNHHFSIVEKVMSRLHFHQAKISFAKSNFCKQKINFFGFHIANNSVIVDPNRVDKLLKTPMFNSPKGARAFLGLLNSFRTYCGFSVLKHVPVLTPLTSSKLSKFEPTKEQIDAFESLKKELTKGPIFSRIISPTSPKIIFSDMAGGPNSLYSAVLCQVVYPTEGKPYVPLYLNLEDITHRYIFDNRLRAKPLPLKLENQTISDFLKRVDSQLPVDLSYHSDPLLGYNESQVQNSLGITMQLMLDIWKGAATLETICKDMVAYIRKTIFRQQFMDFHCNQDKKTFDLFLRKILQGILPIDKKLLIFEVISQVTYRPVILIIDSKNHKPYLEYNADKNKPPLIFLVYERNNQFITRPCIYDKQESYKLAENRGTLEVCSYIAKTMGENYSHCHILDLELNGLLFALKSFSKLIGQAETLLLTDSKPLYYLFSGSVLANSQKLSRWNYKLMEEHPNLKLRFIKSEDNIADFLSRDYQVAEPLPKINMPRYVSSTLTEILPDKIFSLAEWKEFVDTHPDYLITSPPVERTLSVKIMNAEQKAIKQVLTPIETLKTRISTEEIIKYQKIEYSDIISNCISSDGFKYTDEKRTFLVKNALLLIEYKDELKVLIPTELLPIFIAYAHLYVGHQGYEKMKLNLSNFFHPDLSRTIRMFAKACFGCQIQNSPTHLEKYGLFPLPTSPFEVIHLDLIENLPKYRKYQHILTIGDALTGSIFCYPMTSKKATEFLKIFTTQIYQHFGPKRILCDQGGLFMADETMTYLAALNCQMYYSSSHWSPGKGFIESCNKIIKYSIIKYMADYNKANWCYLLPLVTRLFNTSRLNKTEYTPFQLLYGSNSSASQLHLDLIDKKDFHPSIKNLENTIMERHNHFKETLNSVAKRIQDERIKRIDKLNKTRHPKNFEAGELVLIRNYSYTPGVSKTLTPVFHQIPFRIISTSEVTSVVRRVTDNFTQKMSNNDIKRYQALDKDFLNLPSEVLSIVSKRYEDLTDKEIAQLIEKDDFQLVLPSPLTEEEPIKNKDSIESSKRAEKDSDSENSDNDLDDGYNLRPRNKRVTFKQ